MGKWAICVKSPPLENDEAVTQVCPLDSRPSSVGDSGIFSPVGDMGSSGPWEWQGEFNNEEQIRPLLERSFFSAEVSPGPAQHYIPWLLFFLGLLSMRYNTLYKMVLLTTHDSLMSFNETLFHRVHFHIIHLSKILRTFFLKKKKKHITWNLHLRVNEREHSTQTFIVWSLR